MPTQNDPADASGEIPHEPLIDRQLELDLLRQHIVRVTETGTGHAVLILGESEDPAELVRTATAIAARYMGAERAGEFGKRNGVAGELVVRLRPVKVLSAFDLTG